jgi:hypothetical protein
MRLPVIGDPATGQGGAGKRQVDHSIAICRMARLPKCIPEVHVALAGTDSFFASVMIAPSRRLNKGRNSGHRQHAGHGTG